MSTIEICDRQVGTRDIEEARVWATFYRDRGFQPLPSRPDDKKPFCRFAEYWEKKFEHDLFQKFPTSNIQVMTGRYWGLIVYDIDGPEAKEVALSYGPMPRTWITSSGGSGSHWWFLIPKDYPRPMPKGLIWKGEGEHSAIERLCDHSLIMTPPSIHPENGRRYKFRSKLNSPLGLAAPAACPRWLLERPLIDDRPKVSRIHPARQPLPRASEDNGRRYGRDEVISAIDDKIGLATKWGIKFASNRPSPSGWLPCHAYDRPDKNPSAAIHVESGCYTDRGSGTRLSLFDLAVALNVYHDWQDAVQQLGAFYVG